MEAGRDAVCPRCAHYTKGTNFSSRAEEVVVNVRVALKGFSWKGEGDPFSLRTHAPRFFFSLSFFFFFCFFFFCFFFFFFFFFFL
jgi:hypothetical protein